MFNLMVVFTFFTLNWKHSSWANLVQKKNCKFKLKYGTKTNSNMQNLMVVFTFSLLFWKHCFWTNFAQKIKINSNYAHTSSQD